MSSRPSIVVLFNRKINESLFQVYMDNFLKVTRVEHSHWSGLSRSSLVLYGIRDRWLPCTERSYYRRPYAIKNQLAKQHHAIGPDLGS